jgi:pimeloyl-ACP methyl ester carboxylesterase
MIVCCYRLLLHRFAIYRAGLTKYFLTVDDDGSAAFSYSEKGIKVDGKPSIVFVHGLSSNKETWLPIIKVSMQRSLSADLLKICNSILLYVYYRIFLIIIIV